MEQIYHIFYATHKCCAHKCSTTVCVCVYVMIAAWCVLHSAEWWLGSRGSCREECHSALTFLCKLITNAAKSSRLLVSSFPPLCLLLCSLFFSPPLFHFISYALFCLHFQNSLEVCVQTNMAYLHIFYPQYFPSQL